MTYRVGLTGCGWVSGEHISAIKNNPKAEMVAIVSHDIERAKAKTAECGIDVPCFTSVDAMMKSEKPDIVSITSMPTEHVEQGICAAEHGAQLIMEKPIALNIKDIQQLLRCIQANKTKSIVSFVLRWNPLFGIIRSQLDNNSLGDLFYGEVDYYHGIGPWYRQYEWNKTREAGGNSLLSAGCHALDGLVWFMGSRVQEVHAFSTKSTAEIYQAYEYDPTIVSILKFENGRCGKVTSCIECNSPYLFNISLFGNKGTIRDNRLYCDALKGQTDFATIPTITPDNGDVTHHPFQGEIDHFVDCLDQGIDSAVNIEYASHIMEVCFAAQQSAESGESVSIS